MTKKDFELIASVFKDNFDTYKNDDIMVKIRIETIINVLTGRLSLKNPRFQNKGY